MHKKGRKEGRKEERKNMKRWGRLMEDTVTLTGSSLNLCHAVKGIK